MSVAVVRDQIERFLGRAEPEVIAIAGDWGSGKTVTWQQVFESNKSTAKLRKYSYVSLFGESTIDGIKLSIFHNLISLDETETNAEKNAKNPFYGLINATKAAVKRRFFHGTISVLVKDFMSLLESLAFFSISETIICFDDLERRNQKLDIDEILGLISLLREQKKCKIAILLNDKSGNIEDYKKYREKVIDIELEFNPTPKECSDIAFVVNDEISDTLKALAVNLEIKNIRVLQKIDKLARTAFSIIKYAENEVKYQILHTLVLLTWSFYCGKGTEGEAAEGDAPPFDFVIKKGRQNRTAQKTDKEKLWNETLLRYNFYSCDMLDAEIANAVISGYFVEGSLIEQVDLFNRLAINDRAEGSIKGAWSLYHDSFDNNQDDIVDVMYENIMAHPELVSVSSLYESVSLFRYLDENEKANAMVDNFIVSRDTEKNLFDLNNPLASPFVKDVDDPYILEKFLEAHARQFDELKERIEEVINAMAERNGWNGSDLISLRSARVDEIYAVFKKMRGEILRNAVVAVLQVGSHDQRENGDSRTIDNVKTVLRKISEESRINKRRIQRKYGFQPDTTN